MKYLKTLAYLFIAMTTFAAGQQRVAIERVDRYDQYGQIFYTDSLYYRWTLQNDGATIFYWYGYPDTTGNATIPAPIRYETNIPLPMSWSQMHPDSIRNKLVRQLNLTLKP